MAKCRPVLFGVHPHASELVYIERLTVLAYTFLLEYGVSVTDGCIGWEETERIVLNAAALVREARMSGGKVDIL